MYNIAILGFGTVGNGAYEVLTQNADLIESKVGERVNIKYILDLREFNDLEYSNKFIKDFEIIVNDEDIKIVVEVMGGIHPAYEYVKACLESGKIDDAFEYVKTLVVAFPDYIDGLVLYGKFLLHYASLGEESELTKALRKKGLKSIDMEIQDSKPRIPVSDCLFRMEESLKRRTNLDTQKATLQIEYLKLKWLSDKTTSFLHFVLAFHYSA